MKKFISIIAFTMLMMGSITGYAQNIGFKYDKTGNRTSRFVIHLKDIPVKDTASLAHENLLNGTAIIIKPNPTGGVLNVQILKADNKQEIKIYLHNVSGKLLFKNEHCTNNTLVDITSRENGMYILSVLVNNEKRTWKIIKE